MTALSAATAKVGMLLDIDHSSPLNTTGSTI